ncbi:HNH endonuclease [Lysinibacillus sp. NPDC093712]|uniref:HNH endonuclease n=1 Tax=Lysinibacillus sp. NPDC093712 TaxID=3390579 RepID=UPI003D094D57
MNVERLELLPFLLDKYKSKLTIDVEKGTVVGLKNFLNHKGYLTVAFWHEGKTLRYRVHEIVSYVGGLELLNLTVNHINENKLDNRLCNLETVTALENHRKYNFPKGDDNPQSKLTYSQILEITTNYSGRRGEKAILARKYNVSPSTITKAFKLMEETHK